MRIMLISIGSGFGCKGTAFFAHMQIKSKKAHFWCAFSLPFNLDFYRGTNCPQVEMRAFDSKHFIARIAV